MRAYPETLLSNARSLLADAVDYATVDLKVDIDDFLLFFSASEWAGRIERGDRAVIQGVSGIELAQRVLAEKTGMSDFKEARISYSRSSEYWVGWILATYQWASAREFREIISVLPGSTIKKMYGVYHEAPEERFIDTANAILTEKLPETRLRRLRLAYGYSQARLAEVSGVGLRSIQMYEQRQKNINKAEAESVLKLARALSCEMEDLIER